MTRARIEKLQSLLKKAVNIISWEPKALSQAKSLLDEASGLLEQELVGTTADGPSAAEPAVAGSDAPRQPDSTGKGSSGLR